MPRLTLARVRRWIDPYLLMLIGAIVLAVLLPAQGVGRTLVGAVTYAAVALLFFLYGARLAPSAVWEGLSQLRLQALVLTSTYVLFPLMGMLFLAAAGSQLSPEMGVAIMFLCVLPSTVQSSIALTAIARGNVAAALCGASISNLGGVVLTPLLVSLLLPVSGDGASLDGVRNIGIQLLLPFVAGQLLRPRLAGWLSTHRQLTTAVDRGSILLVVYAAFSAGVIAGVWRELMPSDLTIVLAAVVAMLALSTLLTRAASRGFGLSTEDEITAIFCGSQKSMASGIPMATVLFPATVVGFIVVPLMLYHQLQLFVGAMIAQRYAARGHDPWQPSKASA